MPTVERRIGTPRARAMSCKACRRGAATWPEALSTFSASGSRPGPVRDISGETWSQNQLNRPGAPAAAAAVVSRGSAGSSALGWRRGGGGSTAFGSIWTVIRLAVPGLGGLIRFAENSGKGVGISAVRGTGAQNASIPRPRTVARRNMGLPQSSFVFSNPSRIRAIRPENRAEI